MSARVDEAIIPKIGSLAKQMGATKKAIIQEAILLYGEKVQTGEENVFERTLGAWSRKEPPRRTAAKARTAFRKSMERHAR